MTTERLPWLLAAGVLAAAAAPVAGVAAAQSEGRMMDPYPRLYAFVQDGLTIGPARILRVNLRPGPGQQEIVEVELQVLEAWWGPRPPTEPMRYLFRRPRSELSQLKFPDPRWGRVTLEAGRQLLLAYRIGAPEPEHVDPLDPAGAPQADAIRALLAAERPRLGADARFALRLQQLQGRVIEKLYAGEALAHHRGPFTPAQQSQLGEVFARAYADERDAYVKASLGTWLWDALYRKLDRGGRSQVLNATLASAAGPAGLTRTQALDRLARAEPAQLREPEVKPLPAAAALLQERLGLETDAGAKRQLEEVIAALRR